MIDFAKAINWDVVDDNIDVLARIFGIDDDTEEESE